ncbi:SCO2522 family protein [Nocardia blacklockiae]|uniref:SCO2522 family protein n=1 Tax=Nocardia blacklockiae TaxID=480036 RepID=UPI0018956199|nr:SCO2522 family protein [Nocardia blacklockiae]MBF6174016.1 hypothetical protein [Nocardia blacklockiae]
MREPPGYSESAEEPRVASIPLSHLSIEVGRCFAHDLGGDGTTLRADFRRTVPMVSAFAESVRVRFGPRTRISTCYLIDDCSGPDADVAKTLTALLTAAADTGLSIDYLARASGCRETRRFVDGAPAGEPIPVAEMVAARIVAEPAPPETGGRKPTAESGWLCNGRRASDQEPSQAMGGRPYVPPEEFGRREHSIFLDVQLWSRTHDGGDTVTRWSPAFLAAVWHLLRLGLLRYHGAPVVEPHAWQADPWPNRWQDVPPVLQLEPRAAPFAAYRTLSMLPESFLPIEHAVLLVLDHLDLDDDVLEQIVARGAAEGVPVSREPAERLAHSFLGGS